MDRIFQSMQDSYQKPVAKSGESAQELLDFIVFPENISDEFGKQDEMHELPKSLVICCK